MAETMDSVDPRFYLGSKVDKEIGTRVCANRTHVLRFIDCYGNRMPFVAEYEKLEVWTKRIHSNGVVTR